MKKIYTLSLLCFCFLLTACSKDFLKRYEDRIVGTWRVADVDRAGIGGSISNLPFRDGSFTFAENGTLTYVSATNVTYQGSWQIDKKIINDQTLRSLQITAIDFTNQQVLSEYYDDMNFAGTDHFRATINSNFRSSVTHFRR